LRIPFAMVEYEPKPYLTRIGWGDLANVHSHSLMHELKRRGLCSPHMHAEYK
jgi:hypothetical protein